MTKKKKNKKNRKLRKKNDRRNVSRMLMKEDTQSKFQYQLGHFVKVKKDVNDPDYGIDIEGWKGKISEIENENSDDPLLGIEWDAETLRKIPVPIIKACEKDNLDDAKMSLFASEVESAMPENEKAGNKVLVTTMTQEPYMLARIHYDLFDGLKIQDVFSSLNCMAYDRIKDRWVWLYEAEAMKIKFKASYHDIPKERRPIILGSFHSVHEEQMYLDVNSFERAEKAILFFDRYLKRTVAKVSDITVLNKIFDRYDGNLPKHSDYFDQRPTIANDPEKLMKRLKDEMASIQNPLEKLHASLAVMETENRKTLPEVERFPTHFYTDGIKGLRGSLAARETIAMEHWEGNKDYSFHDLFEKIVNI